MNFLDGLKFVSVGVNTECPECGGASDEDGCFSRSRCEVCDSEGGLRYPYHGVVGDLLVHGDCCGDCVMRITYED